VTTPDVSSILKSNGPSLSSDIVGHLLRAGLKPEAARQRVSRAGGTVKRLSGIQFPNREKFLFLETQFNRPEYYERLIDALYSTRSCYGRALMGLHVRGGSIPKSHFPIVSGSPVSRAKGQPQHSFVVDRLQKLKLITISDGAEGIVSLTGAFPNRARQQAIAIVENIVLANLKSYLVKVGWTSSNVVSVRDHQVAPTFGQFAWDLVGPCYLEGLRSYQQQTFKHGFVFGDILLDREIGDDELWPFFAKWDVLNGQRRPTRFQPFFVGEPFKPDTLMKLRKRGCMIVMPSVFFGEATARNLKELIQTIAHAASAVASEPGKVFELIRKVSKIEGAALNLRGILLEMIVAHLFKQDGYDIEIRQRVSDAEGREAEIDVRAKKPAEWIGCECKGKAPGMLVDVAEINEWIETALKRIKEHLKRSNALPETRRFLFYASTDYTPEARALVARIEESHKRQPIKFLAGTDLIKQLRSRKETALVNVFREQFT
jgi:hypothetical protein